MPKGFRVAAVSFLNTIPLLEGLMDEDDIVEIVLDLPSRLLELLASDKADAALIPLIKILANETGGILCQTGIACDGPVESVQLFANGSLKGLCRVFADRGSRSSVALLKILLAESHGSQPEFIEIEPRLGYKLESDEGILVIGDRCFAQVAALAKNNPQDLQAWDLGAMWQNLTGLPFVFAAWAASPDLVGHNGLARVCQLGAVLTAARERGLARIDELAAEQAKAGRLGRAGEASASAIAYYYRHSLRFELGLREREGIRCFAGLCKDHGLISAEPSDLWLCQGDESV